MENIDTGKTHGREQLKKFFANGQLPSETHFRYLIDSMINKEDDGFYKDQETGLHIGTLGSSKRLVSFYQNIDDHDVFFFIDKNTQDIPALKLHPGNTKSTEEEEDSFYFHEGGKFGIGKKCEPEFKLDVGGFAAMEGRMGTYGKGIGSVPANGDWHTIIDHLDNCQAFEIMARAGRKTKGKFAIMHAIALSAFGRSSSKIRKTCAYYGFFWNKLSLRWVGKTRDYALQLRTNCNYGSEAQIYYSITKLWNDEDKRFSGTEFYPPQSHNND